MRGSAPKLTLAAAAVLAAVVAPAAVVARARRPTHVAHRSAGAVVAASSSSSTLRTFALPAGARASGDYTVRARTPGGAWRTVGVYATQVNLSDPA
ncbi:MAG TPA: hypothetical protein VHB30_06870, partial [Solirubrobacteraceae bacterium]|nr:hypothetical protein [Solirubrobacteraceae bacterium]